MQRPRPFNSFLFFSIQLFRMSWWKKRKKSWRAMRLHAEMKQSTPFLFSKEKLMSWFVFIERWRQRRSLHWNEWSCVVLSLSGLGAAAAATLRDEREDNNNNSMNESEGWKESEFVLFFLERQSIHGVNWWSGEEKTNERRRGEKKWNFFGQRNGPCGMEKIENLWNEALAGEQPTNKFHFSFIQFKKTFNLLKKWNKLIL